GRDAGVVPRARMAGICAGAARAQRRPEVPGIPRRRLRSVARSAGLRQHRRAADQGSDAAADELRTQQPDRHARVARHHSARASRHGHQRPRAAGTGACTVSAPKALIMAGGTGGHVFPALALARELQSRSWQIVWLGTRRGLEARIVPAEHIAIEWLRVSGLRGKGLLAWLVAPVQLLRALSEALAAIRRHQPTVVVGLGGFVSGP